MIERTRDLLVRSRILATLAPPTRERVLIRAFAGAMEYAARTSSVLSDRARRLPLIPRIRIGLPDGARCWIYSDI